MSSVSTLEILMAAEKIIYEPERWTQGAVARDSCGFQTYPSSPKAVQWCASSAMILACVELDEPDRRDKRLVASKALSYSIDTLYGPSKFLRFWNWIFNRPTRPVDPVEKIIGFNDEDGRKHSEVKNVFDHAIATEMTKREKVGVSSECLNPK